MRFVLILVLMEFEITKVSVAQLVRVDVLILVLMEFEITLKNPDKFEEAVRLNPCSNGI